MKRLYALLAVVGALTLGSSPLCAGDWVVYEGGKGPGKGKHIVFLAGDEEYRSEEALPQLAKILATRHGFKCTVLFSVNKQSGAIDPNTKDNIPGIEALDTADLCVMLWRFRELPDDRMKHFVDYFKAGKPIIALRTSTHAFNYGKDSQSAYKHYSYNSGGEWKGGFGKQVLGETWVSHWGKHKVEATRGIIQDAAKKLPLFKGVDDIFGDTDVYEAHPPQDATILVLGQVLKGMKPTDEPADYKKKTSQGEQPVNDPMQPVVWLRDYKNEAGKVNKILTTTMGSATDLQSEGFRRLLVNGAYALTGLEKQIPAKADVNFVGEYIPTMYGFNGFKKGVKPVDHELK